MSAVVSLDSLLDQRRVWRGQPTPRAPSRQPSGHAALDAALPTGGWPEAALTEILLPGPGLGELHLLWPSLARLTQAAERVVLVAPPFVPYAPAWQAAGLDLRHLAVIQASGRDALWATEQCLRSGSCAALLCWPERADDRALRRLQVAAESGQTLAFAYRPLREAHTPSPAALRLALDDRPGHVRVLKCRGGLAPVTPIGFAAGR
ncbi:translesion DNA synthesis-associated protein ImuA [Pseudomonas benzenivorans]|uniref:Translesion DNA synthesis-associated protein ImuA n=1 Tax=Pseudomonas benzenivorans TaxID=556533 RepID=A0ABY5HAV3_9PSED|nr:translesion DNA synthesis-associated protein ImuA [Pseudomonas benzenivorans]UTW09204.1 translesion DNA synthesis-associated protein ImuA [Pseudomonas benzenivorans]